MQALIRIYIQFFPRACKLLSDSNCKFVWVFSYFPELSLQAPPFWWQIIKLSNFQLWKNQETSTYQGFRYFQKKKKKNHNRGQSSFYVVHYPFRGVFTRIKIITITSHVYITSVYYNWGRSEHDRSIQHRGSCIIITITLYLPCTQVLRRSGNESSRFFRRKMRENWCILLFFLVFFFFFILQCLVCRQYRCCSTKRKFYSLSVEKLCYLSLTRLAFPGKKITLQLIRFVNPKIKK